MVKNLVGEHGNYDKLKSDKKMQAELVQTYKDLIGVDISSAIPALQNIQPPAQPAPKTPLLPPSPKLPPAQEPAKAPHQPPSPKLPPAPRSPKGKTPVNTPPASPKTPKGLALAVKLREEREAKEAEEHEQRLERERQTKERQERAEKREKKRTDAETAEQKERDAKRFVLPKDENEHGQIGVFKKQTRKDFAESDDDIKVELHKARPTIRKNSIVDAIKEDKKKRFRLTNGARIKFNKWTKDAIRYNKEAF